MKCEERGALASIRSFDGHFDTIIANFKPRLAQLLQGLFVCIRLLRRVTRAHKHKLDRPGEKSVILWLSRISSHPPAAAP